MRSAGVVVAGHRQTAEAGAQMLRAGGNAFDAIVAQAWAACVTEPVLASIGGGGFLLARPAEAPAAIYDFFVHTPRARRPAAELDFEPVEVDFGATRQTFHIGAGSVATPGLVRGLFETHRRLGSLPMRELIAPAARLAREGVRINAFQARIARMVEPLLTAEANTRELFGHPGEGESQRFERLADLLDALAVEGDDLFYRGEIARSIADYCAERGGYLTREDLASYAMRRREPLAVGYRGVQVLTNAPPAAGGLLIAFGLQLLEAAAPAGFGTHGHLDALVHALTLTDTARLDSQHDDQPGIDAARLLDPDLLTRYRGEILDRARSVRGTTHFNAIDAAGNVAAMTLSNGSSAGRVVPGTGFLLNNMLGEQDLNPQGFHRFPLDQRISSMMAPTVADFPDGRVVATGSGGSNRIRTAILQVLTNVIDHGMPLVEAVDAPRLFVENGLVSAESGFDDPALERLALDHRVHGWDHRSLYFGGVNSAELRHGAAFGGAGDPRRGGASIVV